LVASSQQENTGQETAAFLSEDSGYSVQYTNNVERSLTSDSIDAMYLANFLSRPVNIFSYTWAETEAPGGTHQFLPWALFFSDSRIKEKLNRFAFLQCTLKLKIVINASPFYYGANMLSYQPLHLLSPTTIGYLSLDGTTCLRSQRPHLWIYPQNNAAGEMTLPYLNFRNWTRTIQAADFNELGQCTFQNITYLQSANGAVGTGVTITVFAWAEDVNVSGPTLGTVMAQGGDEYGTISRPSSMIASIASKLTSIPIIAPFALATQLGATAIASIAHIFGYTNVPNIKDVEPINIKPFHNFADTSISFPINKLTLDAKNELSISQAIAGIPDSIDPLNIEDFCSRESFLATVSWVDTDPADQPLFYMDVAPTACNYVVVNVNDTAIYSTPAAYVAANFRQWRGDMIIRVHSVSSKFHKGRFRLIYDPFGDATNNIVSVANSYSGCINTIVDLSEDTNIEFRIPYSQATYYQNVPDFGIPTHQISNTPTFTRDISKHNGAFMIRTVTQLTAPLASTTIQLLVSIKWENIEFANPALQVASDRVYSFKVPQAGLEYDTQSIKQSASSTGADNSKMNCVVFGEKIVSLRQLIKRMNYLFSQDISAAPNNGALQNLTLGRLPPTFGYETNGLDSAVGLITPGSNFGFNYALMSPLTWFTPCFVGQRGSVNYAINAGNIEGAGMSEIYVSRLAISSGVNNSYTQTQPTVASLSKYAEWASRQYKESSAGATITTGTTNNAMEFQVPLLTQYKFQSAKVDQGSVRITDDGSDHDIFHVVIRNAGVQHQNFITVYCGAGTDFNLIFFINCPVVHKYNAVPTAA
jgi:hypothetical protein